MKKVNVQIPWALFNALYDVHILGVEDTETLNRIEQGLKEKMDAIIRREAFTASKTADTAEKREEARQIYVKEAGFLKDWQY